MSQSNLLYKFPHPQAIISTERYHEHPLDIPKIIELNSATPLYELIIENYPLELTADLSSQLERLTQLIYLGLNRCNLNDLLNIPLLSQLSRLTLDYNQIENEQLKYLSFYNDKLLSLSLIDNNIDLMQLDNCVGPLKDMVKLVQLSISGNVEDRVYVEVRTKILMEMPNLQYLDCIQRNQQSFEISGFKSLAEEHEYLARYEHSQDIIQKQLEVEGQNILTDGDSVPQPKRQKQKKKKKAGNDLAYNYKHSQRKQVKLEQVEQEEEDEEQVEEPKDIEQPIEPMEAEEQEVHEEPEPQEEIFQESEKPPIVQEPQEPEVPQEPEEPQISQEPKQPQQPQQSKSHKKAKQTKNKAKQPQQQPKQPSKQPKQPIKIPQPTPEQSKQITESEKPKEIRQSSRIARGKPVNYHNFE